MYTKKADLSAFFDSWNLTNLGYVMIKINKTIIVISIFLTSLVLSSCQEEQGRILSYKKGVYLGKKDASLTKEQVNKLKMHTSRQRSN